MDVAASFARADGLVTNNAAPGTGVTVRYDFFGAWVFGGVGVVDRPNLRPTRILPADNQQIVPAPRYSPATLTVDPQGVERLFVDGEQYVVEEC